MFVIPEGGERLHMAYIDVAPEGDLNGRTGLLLHGRNFPWKLIKPKVLNQPGNDPGIVADAHFRLNRFLPVLDKQLEGRDYVIGPLSVVDFLIAPRFDLHQHSSASTSVPTRTSMPGSRGSVRGPIGRTLEKRGSGQRTPFFDFFTTSLPFAAAVFALMGGTGRGRGGTPVTFFGTGLAACLAATLGCFASATGAFGFMGTKTKQRATSAP